MSPLHHPRHPSRRALRRARTARRRATVLAVVLALLAPLALVSTAGAAVAAGTQATLQITRFTAATGATASSPALETDATYTSDLGYTVSPATGTVKLDAAYRCASDTEDCVDAAVTFSLDRMRLTTGVAVGGFTVAPVVTYYTDLDAGTTTTDPTAASAFSVSFRSVVTDGGTGLTAGVTGTLSVEAALTTPDGGGTQTGTVVVQPSSAVGTSTPSRVRLIGEFPVALSTSTTLSWARAGYLSGVDDGVETPTNTATIVSTNTGDPAATLTTSWGADPTARPAAGTVGMLDDLTSLRLTAWPTGATSATVTGWTWTSATTAPAQVAVATVAATDPGAGDDLLAGLDATTRAALTGLRVVFTTDGGTIASGAAATYELGIREHGSVGSTPTARTGTVDYVTDAPAATFDAASDLNTLTVTGTATTVAVRGTYTSSTSSATRGFRVYDPRAYAGSSTTLAALAGDTVYGGGYVRAVSAGTNWSRRAVEQLVVAVRPDQADVTATNGLLDPDLAAIDSRVFGSGLTFAGFGAAKNGSGTGDGSGAALTELIGSGATLTLTVTADGVTTTPVVLDASVASPALPTDPAAFGLGSWSQVTGFTATVAAAGGSAVVPMGASVSVPYLLRAATAADVLTYADHTRATTVLGSDTSSVLPRSATSGNRPVTAATIAVAVPTVGVAGLKHVVEPYVLTSAGSTATAVLEVTARDGASGHEADTLIVEDSARATTAGGTTGAAWWNVMQPVSVDTGSATGVSTRIEYYVATSSGVPVWQEFIGTPDDLGDTSAWLGLRLVAVHTDGSTFEDGTTLRSRITFAVRASVRGGQTWTTGTALTNVARITSEATIEGNTVVSPVVPGSDAVEAVAPGSGGERALLKVLSSLQGVEGTADAPTATLTWGTAGQDLASVTVTDANGLGAGDGEPSTGAADSFWDTFDLTAIRAITSDDIAVSGAAYDPYLAFDQISDVLVYDATAGATGWHSLRDEEWTGSAWEPLSGTRTDVTFAGTVAAGDFPYAGSFPGVSISTGLRARIGGVRLVYEARSDAERATVLAADDWRQALLPTLTTDAVAATDGPARQVVLALALRDTARSTGTPVNNAYSYNGSAAGKVVNSGRVTGWSGTGATGTATDLGGPINGSGNWTYQVQQASVGATATKSWLRDANGTPLEQSTDLDELALPVDGSDPAAWPTATLKVSGKTTATTRVDSLTITEPRGIDTATTFGATQPFAQYSVLDLVSLTAASSVSGATDVQVVLYRWTVDKGLTADDPVSRTVALGYAADTLTDVVGVQVRYTGRIARNATASMTLSTRLLAENRVSGDATTADLQVDNEVEVTVSDARVCADESGSPTAATGCTPAVATARAAASTSVRDAEVLAFPALAVTPVDVQRDADVATVTSTLSVQNFGLTPADQLVLTDADPRYFNAVGVTRVALDTLPTGADEATLEVLLAGDALTIDADGAYAGTQTWQSWGTIASGAWDLAALAATHGTDASAVIGVRLRFTDTNGSLIPAPGQGYGQVTLTGALRTELLTGGLPSAVGAEGWTYAGAAELTTNPGESVRGRISNHVSGQALRAGVPSSPQTTDDVTVSVHAGAATLRVQKTEVDAASRAPGDLVQYRITLTNTASGTGAADLTGLVLTDRLPEDGSLVYGDAPDGQQPWSVAQSGGMADPTVTADESSVVLTWTDQDRLAPGAQVVVLLWLRVSTDLSTTSVVNVATAGSASRPVLATSTGGDGENACAAGSYDTTSGECRAAAGALVIGGANVYVSEEWVRDAASTAGAVRTTAAKAGTSSACTPRGTGSDASWYRYPCSVVTTAGSTTDWQIQVTSRASISTDKLEMVDMLSQVGDYPAMSDSGSRGSQWRPVWDGVVPTLVGTYPAGATVEVYTTTADYRSGGVAASEDFDPVPGTWSSTPLTPGTTVPAAQAARVTGFKFVVTFAAADRLSSGESVRVQWSMRTPLTGATEAADTWNSFAFRVPADAAAGRPMDVTSVPLKAGARYAVAAAAADPLVAVGDRVWLDTDRDGVQDDGEAGVAGVVVDLYTAAGDWAGETTTDAAGDYLFDGLPAGDYEIRLTLPAALADLYTLTDLAAGSDPTVDSDAVRESDTESVIAAVSLTADDSGLMTAVADMPAAWQTAHPGLTATFVDATRDAGLQWRWLSVGDTVWFDADRDGRQGATEDPVVGATVRLLGADDAVLATTTTDADGGYLFDRLDPGTYRVQVEIPAALADRWTFTQGLVGDALGDSDIAGDTSVTGRSAAFTLSAGVSGRMVRTSDLAGTPVYAGVTADYVDPTVDAGLAERPVRVGDRVWVDLDGDGVQDAGEPGLAGVVLTLTDALSGTPGDPVTDASGATVGPTTTDADGAYAFTGLLPGSYTVTVDTTASAAVLAPYLATPAGASGDRATDSDTGSATSLVLVGGEQDLTLDFGYRPLRAIGDRVWLDTDRDGAQEAGEPGFAGVTVRLLDAATDAVLATTTTDADGLYRFDLLEPGEYRVELELAPADAVRYGFTTALATTALGAAADSDAVAVTGTPGTARTATITVGPDAPGQRASVAADGVVAALIDPTWDAGLVELPVSVGDTVWYDADGDGVQDADEPGLPGVVLELTGTDGRPVTDVDGATVGPVTTDADGAYLFTGLLPGGYTVTIDRIASAAALAGYTPTLAGVGTDRAVDSSTWTAGSAVLVGGEQDLTLDFGMVLADDVQLALRKSVVSRTADTITWDVTVASTGTQDAYAGFAVVDALPGALSFSSAAGDGFACTAVDQVVTCDHAGSLPAGEQATVRIVTGVDASTAEVTNTATVDVTGRGYLFEVLSAQDDAISDPVPVPAAQTLGARLAATGASAALPLGLAVLMLVLGGVLLALRRRT